MNDLPSEVRHTSLADLASREPLPNLTSAQASTLPRLPWNLVNVAQDGTTLVIAVQLGRSPRIAGVEVVDEETGVHVIVRGTGLPSPDSLAVAPARTAIAVVALPHPLDQRLLLGAEEKYPQ